MVIVRSGDGALAPEWSAEASRLPSEPPRALIASEPPSSEPFPLARDLEPTAEVSSDRASTTGWDDPELDKAASFESPAPPDALRQEPERDRTSADRISSKSPAESGGRRFEAGAEPARDPSKASSDQAGSPSPVFSGASKRWTFVVAAGLALAGYLAFRGSSSEPVAHERAPEVAKAKPAEEQVEPAKTAASEAPQPQPTALPAPAGSAPAGPPKSPSSAEAAGVAAKPASARAAKPVPPNATRVRLEVYPPDAKVGRKGITQKPPYEFDVTKGKRVELEVLKKGYVTRKVTLDGTSSRVVVGLARSRPARGAR
jgi:hypothetical protein